ncbi:LytTR family DNA-binding domain-containing protein [Niabella sp. CC-SYL272]|uniref:LytR/AlgR family response regulator transcription factor n=1 Tax=Niabella agricola TaxID=2891571 RepID=UPI001F1E1A85|nr:LytTR family DNA-binding domain-containing protein [Niabella agricola]MCF3107745.1 LytTR family DNA-binding domain-containing protein [Niabella agricola]
MNIVIIEDEAKAANGLKKIIENGIPGACVPAILGSVKSSLDWFQKNAMPDLIFSDVQLSDGLSFEIFKQADISCPAIFCTAYDQYAIDAFTANGIDYLLKPIDEEKLVRAVQKLQKLKSHFQPPAKPALSIQKAADQIITQPKSALLVYYRDNIIPLKVTEIRLIYAVGGIVRIYAAGDKLYFINETLDELEAQLPTTLFFKANRQFIINKELILSVHQHFGRKLSIKMKCEVPETIVVSKAKASEFLKWLQS